MIVQPQSQSQNNSGEISNFPNCEAAKGGFLCGGCSRLFGSEQEQSGERDFCNVSEGRDDFLAIVHILE